MYIYQAFGLSITADLKIIECLPIKDTDRIDVHILSGVVPDTIKENQNQLLINLPQIGKILIENGVAISYMKHVDTHEDNLRLFLLGSAMGALLQQRGYIVLHGNAISFDKKTCSIFVGNQGAGKSTTAAWHYQQGASILADDVCAIYFESDGKPYVIPSYPQLKLWKNSTDLLNISTTPLRRLRAQDEKFALPILESFSAKPLAIDRIIEIQQEHITEENVKSGKKLSILTKHSYRYHFLNRMGLTSAYSKSLMRLAGKVEMLTQNRPVLLEKKCERYEVI